MSLTWMVESSCSISLLAAYGLKYAIISGREWHLKWHRSPEPIEGLSRYVSHLTNKKWPLREVLTIDKTEFKFPIKSQPESQVPQDKS